MVNHRSEQRLILASVAVLGLLMAPACGGRQSPDADTARPSIKESPEMRGEEIVAEHLKRDASPYRKDRVRFTIRSTDEPVEVYEIDVLRRQTEKETATLSLIVKPVEDAGSGSLAIETEGQPTVNTTYSAARGEYRETDTGKMFFGGLTAQELLGEWAKYEHIFVAERVSGGGKLLEISGKLKKDQRSVIDSTKILFDAQHYFPVEMHLFDKSGKQLRTYRSSETKTAENGRVFVAKTEVVNHIYDSQITIEILSREYPAFIDDSMFTREKLKQFLRK